MDLRAHVLQGKDVVIDVVLTIYCELFDES